MTAADNVLARLRREVSGVYGDSADLSLIEACDPALIVALGTQQRIKVRDARGDHTRTGRVGRSTGPRPVLLLIHRSGSSGSTDVLCAHDRVIARWDGNRYAEET